MALSLTKDYTFAPNTTIASAEVNQDFDELYNAFTGLEAGTSSMSKLPLDANPSSALHAATKQYVDVYASYKRPLLKWISTTQVDVENNTATANQTKIIFPDGDVRTVTEDTSSANKYRRFDITAAAEFTSGTEDSGVRSGISEANNTWYAIYAVKSAINAANFVLSGDTTFPEAANVSTLNSRYGSSSWVHLGYVRNGDNCGSVGDLLRFIQSGNMTMFYNELSTSTGMTFATGSGSLLASTGSATSLSWAYSAGSGTTNVPGTIGHINFNYGVLAPSTGSINLLNSAAAHYFRRYSAASLEQYGDIWRPATGGLYVNTSTGATTAFFIGINGFTDNALGGGSNPLI